jgi:hypothetical protein
MHMSDRQIYTRTSDPEVVIILMLLYVQVPLDITDIL